MYHSLIFQFTDKNGIQRVYNTWDNWHLIPSSRPVVTQPTAAFKYVDIPGRDGQLDTTDYLIGRPTYSNRTGSFEFIVMNGFGPWQERRAELAGIFNGRRMRMTLEDDKNYFYQGRFLLKDWKSENNFSKVTIEYTIDPFRYDTYTGAQCAYDEGGL